MTCLWLNIAKGFASRKWCFVARDVEGLEGVVHGRPVLASPGVEKIYY